MWLTDVVYILGSREGVLDGATGQLCAAFERIRDFIAGRARLICLLKFFKALVGWFTWLASFLDLFGDKVRHALATRLIKCRRGYALLHEYCSLCDRYFGFSLAVVTINLVLQLRILVLRRARNLLLLQDYLLGRRNLLYSWDSQIWPFLRLFIPINLWSILPWVYATFCPHNYLTCPAFLINCWLLAPLAITDWDSMPNVVWVVLARHFITRRVVKIGQAHRAFRNSRARLRRVLLRLW